MEFFSKFKKFFLKDGAENTNLCRECGKISRECHECATDGCKVRVCCGFLWKMANSHIFCHTCEKLLCVDEVNVFRRDVEMIKKYDHSFIIKYEKQEKYYFHKNCTPDWS